MIPGKLGDPLPKVRLHDLQAKLRVVLLQAPVELYLLGGHALRLGDELRPSSARQLADVAYDVLSIPGEEDMSAALLDGAGHLLQVAVEVRHRLLLYVIGPLPQLRRLGQSDQDGVTARDGLVGKEPDVSVEIPVRNRPPPPLVEPLYPADDT